MNVLPNELLAKVLGNLNYLDIANIEIAFGNKEDIQDCIEKGSWLALRAKSNDCDFGYLYDGESWFKLYAALMKIDAKESTLLWLLFDGEPTLKKEDQVVDNMLKFSKCFSTRRKFDAARRLGEAGYWASGTDILNHLMEENQIFENGIENKPRWQAQLRIEASEYLIDNLYASTYVRSTDFDSISLAKAFRWISDAKAMLDKIQSENEVKIKIIKKQNQIMPKDKVPLVSVSLQTQKINCLRVFGKVCALLGQHVGLGAFRSIGYSNCSTIPKNYQQVFDLGIHALHFAISLAQDTDHFLYALCLATKAELEYCQASVLTQFIIIGRIVGHESAPQLIHLAQISVQGTRNALDILFRKVPKPKQGPQIINMCKDLAKVYNFLFEVSTGLCRDDHNFSQQQIASFASDAYYFSSRAYLLGLLQFHPNHPSLQNINRLRKSAALIATFSDPNESTIPYDEDESTADDESEVDNT